MNLIMRQSSYISCSHCPITSVWGTAFLIIIRRHFNANLSTSTLPWNEVWRSVEEREVRNLYGESVLSRLCASSEKTHGSTSRPGFLLARTAAGDIPTTFKCDWNGDVPAKDNIHAVSWFPLQTRPARQEGRRRRQWDIAGPLFSHHRISTRFKFATKYRAAAATRAASTKESRASQCSLANCRDQSFI